MIYNKNVRNEKGFMLIELIIVIVILGIIAVTVIPNMSGTVSDADKESNDITVDLFEDAGQKALDMGVDYDSHDESDVYYVSTLVGLGYITINDDIDSSKLDAKGYVKKEDDGFKYYKE